MGFNCIFSNINMQGLPTIYLNLVLVKLSMCGRINVSNSETSRTFLSDWSEHELLSDWLSQWSEHELFSDWLSDYEPRVMSSACFSVSSFFSFALIAVNTVINISTNNNN